MTAPDRDLIGSYAREGSEPAFRALVARHVHLVYAVALRQVGDAGLAEEVTQNVFVALARKAPGLAGYETLAGWLHRTALLESKARIRAELRRQRREQEAAALATAELESASVGNDLTPLLDEALMELREPDRVALILRFLEERSLREVGSRLGLNEEAARKRVSRALDRVAHFFRARGFAVPVGGSATVLAQAVKAAPATLVASSAQAGLSAGAAATGLNLLFLQLMTLTKTQLTVGCALLVLAPMLWQQRSLALAKSAVEDLRVRQGLEQQRLETAAKDLENLDAASRRVGEDLAEGRRRNALLEARVATQPRVPGYQWDDASPLLRVPKEMLSRLELSAIADKRGKLSPQIIAALQMTPVEVAAVQAALDHFLASYHELLGKAARRVEPRPEDLPPRPAAGDLVVEVKGLEAGKETPVGDVHPDGSIPRRFEEVRVFEVKGLAEPTAALRQDLTRELHSLLGDERWELFEPGLRGWIRIDDEVNMMSSDMAVFATDHRERFFRPTQAFGGEAPALLWGVRIEGRASMTSALGIDEVPMALRPQLQDWIDEARNLFDQAKREAEAAPVVPSTAVAP